MTKTLERFTRKDVIGLVRRHDAVLTGDGTVTLPDRSFFTVDLSDLDKAWREISRKFRESGL